MTLRASHRTPRCRLCAWEPLDLVLPLPATPVGDDYRLESQLAAAEPTFPLDLHLCPRCGLAQLVEVVEPEILYKNFIYRTAISLGLPEHFRQYAAETLARSGAGAGALAVDIGSNDGTLLRAFQDLGLRALGIEPAEAIAAGARAAGTETLTRYFSAELARQLRAERGPAAIVTINNTIANLDDLDDVISGIGELLAADGLGVLETGYLLGLLENGLFDNIYHEHLTYFALKPLLPFMARHGLQVVDAQRLASKGGSIRVFFQKAGGPRPVAPQVETILQAEALAGLHAREGFTRLDQRLEAATTALLGRLEQARAEGKRVAGYGASVGTTTFLHRFRAGGYLEFIADDNPDKHGRFSPGYHLPVLPSSALYSEKPDYVLILAWRYAQPIMQRHRAYQEQGGRFLHAWPEGGLA